ncbi:hypothetical protein [Methanopyrus sp. KOL6]|uniref:hypothetical protein n=1 Tax=Methanopyrus sp. KOL6 TaxID=1937004 RepID=UPI000B4A9D40|nr:hypothetical protein [Methanopyrus sp. KOL6]
MFGWIRRHRRSIVTAGIIFLAAMMVLSAIPSFMMGGQSAVAAAEGTVDASIVKDYQVSVVRYLAVPKPGVKTSDVKSAVSSAGGVENVDVRKVKIKGYTVFVVDALVPLTADPEDVKKRIEKRLKDKVLDARGTVIKGSKFVFQASYDGKPDVNAIKRAIRRELGNRLMDEPKLKVRYNAVVGEVLCNVSDGKHTLIEERIERALHSTGARGCLVIEQLIARLGTAKLTLLGPGKEKVGDRTANFGDRMAMVMVLPEHAKSKHLTLALWISNSGGKQRIYVIDRDILRGKYIVF